MSVLQYRGPVFGRTTERNFKYTNNIFSNRHSDRGRNFFKIRQKTRRFIITELILNVNFVILPKLDYISKNKYQNEILNASISII